MACGTGKTLVALWTVEENLRPGKTALYLVPSLQLMRQTLNAWRQQQTGDHHYLSICSDKTVYKDSIWDVLRSPIPVTTNKEEIGQQLNQPFEDKIRIVLSTYQSLPVLSSVLKSGDFSSFDLVLCDEAHNTTGVVDNRQDGQGAFQMVHSDDDIPAKKRLYFTATPRVYESRSGKNYGPGEDRDCYSMDDPDRYGQVFHKLSFGRAIEQKLLADYQILVIEASESLQESIKNRVISITNSINQLIDNKNINIGLETAVSLLGSWDALADPTTKKISQKRFVGQLPIDQKNHLRSAIAFVNTKKKSRMIAQAVSDRVANQDDYHNLWQKVNQVVLEDAPKGLKTLNLNVGHVDGDMSTLQRAEIINRLKKTEAGSCQIVSNDRVLREGVDVPNLDAVIFLNKRQSQVDIVQAVGRVMRIDSKNKDKIGYVVIPIIVPPGKRITDQDVVSGSEFDTVWSVVRGLKSHDERVGVWASDPDKFRSKLAVVNSSPSIVNYDQAGEDQDSSSEQSTAIDEQLRMIELGSEQATQIASRLVEKCGDKKMWPVWGQNAAKVSQSVEGLIREGLGRDETKQKKFNHLKKSLQKTISDALNDDQVIEMVSQHVITNPIFEKVFSGLEATNNPIAKDINHFLEVFPVGFFAEKLSSLQRAYTTMGAMIEETDLKDRVDLIRQIYDGFFKAAMPNSTKQLGIVYTPLDLVDNIIRLTEDICQKHLGFGLGDEGINILEPFAGTGTFLHRLLTYQHSNGDYLVKDKDLLRKFQKELHGSEIVLMAYYIATVNVTSALDSRLQKVDSLFNGLTLANTFKDFDDSKQDSLGGIGQINNKRLSNQKKIPIQVIIGNPPWSAGKKLASDKRDIELDYASIAQRAKETYGQAKLSQSSTAVRNLYVRSFRWASDRIKQSGKPGIVAFIHPNSLALANSAIGVREVMQQEFSHIYFVDLKGDAMGAKEERRKQGGNVFDMGSRNGVQITFLVYDPQKTINQIAQVYSARVDDYKNREEKAEWLSGLQLSNFSLVPKNDKAQWVDVTDGSFFEMSPVVAKKDNSIFNDYKRGITTNLDDYVYDWSPENLTQKVTRLINAYNKVRKMITSGVSRQKALDSSSTGDIKWTHKLISTLNKDIELQFDQQKIIRVLYRPFVEKWLYADKDILSSPSLLNIFNQDSINIKTPQANPIENSTPIVSAGLVDNHLHHGGGQLYTEETVNDNLLSRNGGLVFDPSGRGANRSGLPVARNAQLSDFKKEGYINYKNPTNSRGQYSSPLVSQDLTDINFYSDGGGAILRRKR